MDYLEIATPNGTRRVELAHERLVIGRLPQCEIALPYVQISRQHAELRRVAGEWWIADLNSTNGVRVNGQQVRAHKLARGDQVLLAPEIGLRLIADTSAPTEPALPPLPPMPQSAIPHFTAPADPTVAQNGSPQVRAAFASFGPAPRATQLPPSPSGGHPDPQHDPYRRTMPVQRRSSAAVALHVCQTCGQLTAPDVDSCQSCHRSISTPCATCGLSLLPSWERCPRCQTVNPRAVSRAQSGFGG